MGDEGASLMQQPGLAWLGLMARAPPLAAPSPPAASHPPWSLRPLRSKYSITMKLQVDRVGWGGGWLIVRWDHSYPAAGRWVSSTGRQGRGPWWAGSRKPLQSAAAAKRPPAAAAKRAAAGRRWQGAIVEHLWYADGARGWGREGGGVQAKAGVCSGQAGVACGAAGPRVLLP